MSSDRAKHWAWKQSELDAYQLLLVLAMADNCGEELICYARLSTLAQMARQSERTVQRNLESLVEMGKVAIVAKRPGRTTLFRILVPVDFGNDAPSNRTPDSVTGVGQKQALEPSNGAGSMATHDNMSGVSSGPTTQSRGPPTGSQGTHDRLSYDSSLNPSLHKPSETGARARAGPASSPARAHDSDSAEAVAKATAIAAELGLDGRWTRESAARFVRRIGEAERELFLLNNTAKQSGFEQRRVGESLAVFRRRSETEHGEILAAEVERRRASAPSPEVTA